jgi:hypothetical protein
MFNNPLLQKVCRKMIFFCLLCISVKQKLCALLIFENGSKVQDVRPTKLV